MKIDRVLATLVAMLLVSLVAMPLHADTIYMKNGRVITSASVRIEGDRVFVRLLDGEVSFPMSLVDRIVEDSAVEEPLTVIPGSNPLPDPDDPANQGDPAQGDPSQGDPLQGDPSQGDPAAGGDPVQQPDPPAGADPPATQPAPEQTRQYWQDLIQPLKDQITGLDREIGRLGGTGNSADVRAQIQRLETSRGLAQDQIDAIRIDARRRGVPPGWVR